MTVLDFVGNELEVGDLVLCAVSGASSHATMKFGLVDKIYQTKRKNYRQELEAVTKVSLTTYKYYAGQWYESKSNHDDFRKMCKVPFLQTLPVDLIDKYVEEHQKLTGKKYEGTKRNSRQKGQPRL